MLSSTPAKVSPTTSPTWKIELLYDGACPFCLREVNFLQKRDGGRGVIAFVDITDDAYRPEEHGGVDFEAAMGRIHAILADGTVIQNLEVFRQIYEVLGIGWIYAITRWPVIGPIAEGLYGLWADWRLTLTGRPDLKTLVAQREQHIAALSGGRCKIDPEGKAPSCISQA